MTKSPGLQFLQATSPGPGTRALSGPACRRYAAERSQTGHLPAVETCRGVYGRSDCEPVLSERVLARGHGAA